MLTINVYEAKTYLSKIINKAIEGEEVIIAKSGKPVVKLVPVKKRIKKRKAGMFRDQITFSEDIDSPLPDEIIEEFYK